MWTQWRKSDWKQEQLSVRRTGRTIRPIKSKQPYLAVETVWELHWLLCTHKKRAFDVFTSFDTFLQSGLGFGITYAARLGLVWPMRINQNPKESLNRKAEGWMIASSNSGRNNSAHMNSLRKAIKAHHKHTLKAKRSRRDRSQSQLQGLDKRVQGLVKILLSEVVHRTTESEKASMLFEYGIVFVN
jgi:hypothetical protein